MSRGRPLALPSVLLLSCAAATARLTVRDRRAVRGELGASRIGIPYRLHGIEEFLGENMPPGAHPAPAAQ